jgi:transcriptional regulator with XRE-family HTH domain
MGSCLLGFQLGSASHNPHPTRGLRIHQRELARLVGVSAAHVVYLESGKRLPSLSLLFRLAKELNVRPSKLARRAFTNLAELLAPAPRGTVQIDAGQQLDRGVETTGWRCSSAESGHESRDLLKVSRISSANAKTGEIPDGAIGTPLLA